MAEQDQPVLEVVHVLRRRGSFTLAYRRRECAGSYWISVPGEQVAPTSASQHVSAVLRYHEDSGFESPTKTDIVSGVLQAYTNKTD